ncbi:MAG: protein-disulfide reductase DsbD family protein [Methylococcales bacterium]|nr:protein-disulfide reductase DsbD family protein [Methylococcales bacterium]
MNTVCADDVLPPDEAFALTVKVKNKNTVLLSWDIADQHYLYQQKFQFTSMTTRIKLGQPIFPAGDIKQDKFFGTVTIYRQHLDLELPLQTYSPELNTLDLKVTYQGCADAGICYMPIEKTVTVDLATRNFLQRIGTLLDGG